MGMSFFFWQCRNSRRGIRLNTLGKLLLFWRCLARTARSRWIFLRFSTGIRGAIRPAEWSDENAPGVPGGEEEFSAPKISMGYEKFRVNTDYCTPAGTGTYREIHTESWSVLVGIPTTSYK